VVSGDLQKLRRILQAMYFVQDNTLSTDCVQKPFWIFHHPANAWQFAIEILYFWKALAKIRFADPPDACKPDDRPLFPRLLDSVCPVMSHNHK
jgi:hypothetical protein